MKQHVFCSYELRDFLSTRNFSVLHIFARRSDSIGSESSKSNCNCWPSRKNVLDVVFTLLDDVSLPTHINMSKNRNMYLSFASLGVVNDLTCLIIIYYVFLGEKKRRQTRQIILKIRREILFKVSGKWASLPSPMIPEEENGIIISERFHLQLFIHLHNVTWQNIKTYCRKTPLSHSQYRGRWTSISGVSRARQN